MKADIESGFEFEQAFLDAWAKLGARINSGFRSYRESVINGLKAEGHHILDPGTDEIDNQLIKVVKESVFETSLELHDAESMAIGQAEKVTHSQYKQVTAKRVKTQNERFQKRRYKLSERYHTDDVTPDLVKKDDNGWYALIRLHYYLDWGKLYL